MKKMMLMSAALLTCAAAFAAGPVVSTQEVAQGLDCEVFLTPYVETALKEMSSKVVLDAGCSVTPHSEMALAARLSQVASGMQVGESMMVAAPASYGVLFTDGTQSDEAVHQHIRQVLAKIGKSKDAKVITTQLAALNEVTRATFVATPQGLKLVTDEKTLKSGQAVWCKTPQGVISAVYQSEEDYLLALRHAGLTCEEIKRPCFFGKVKYDMWRAQQQGGKSLGGAYMTNHPFTLYYVTKHV